jgi:hypothetical protein
LQSCKAELAYTAKTEQTIQSIMKHYEYFIAFKFILLQLWMVNKFCTQPNAFCKRFFFVIFLI